MPTGTDRRDAGRAVCPSRLDIAELFARYREVAREPELRAERFARRPPATPPPAPVRETTAAGPGR